MGKHPVTGVDTLDRFNKLISKGRLVLDVRSNTYFQLNETVDDGNGRRIAKQYDATIHDPLKQLSKYKSGYNWTRGGYGR